MSRAKTTDEPIQTKPVQGQKPPGRDSADGEPVMHTNELLAYMDPGYLADYNTSNAGPMDSHVLTDQDSYTHLAT